MLSVGHKKYLKNPTLGLVPYVTFLISFQITYEIIRSLIIGIVVGIVLELFLRFYGRSKVSTMTIGISVAALVLTLLTKVLFGNHIYSRGIYIVFSEVYLVSMIMLVRAFELHIKESFFWKKNYTQKPFLNDFFHTATFTQYTFTIHLFYMLIYVYLRDRTGPYTILDGISYIWIPMACAIFTIIYENFQIRKVSKKLLEEEWLPIVNEKGEVSGKIAKSESIRFGNRFMHPVIRIALIYKDQIYLQPRTKDSVIDIGSLDYPFEKYLRFNHEINIAARDSIADILEQGDEASLKFLIKYTFKNELSNRLVFLYTFRIESEDAITRFDTLRGKFWTIKQIEDNMTKDQVFSECFQLEYEYLKNTVLMAERIKNAVEFNK